MTAACQLKDMIEKYGAERNQEMIVTHFLNPINFLTNYKSVFDVVFMDIEMPMLNGMNAARKLREIDDEVILVFITNMQQYAAEGYSVEAMDFILKPVQPARLTMLLDKVYRRILVKKDAELVVQHKGVVHRLFYKDILYVEISQHHLIYHKTDGRNIDFWGTLKELMSVLPPKQFFRCNSCYVVNLQYVRSVEDGFVLIGSEKLAISRPRKKEFMNALMEYIGELR